MRSVTRTIAGAISILVAGAAPLGAQIYLPPPLCAIIGFCRVSVPCDTASLVAAVDAASGPDPVKLDLSPGCEYVLTEPSTADDGLPVVTGHVTIAGHDATIRRDSQSRFRILRVAVGATLHLKNVSIVGGDANGIGGDDVGLGGGLANVGTVVLKNVTFSHNEGGNGGALSNGGTMTISRSVFSENATTRAGGAILNYGMLTANDSDFLANTASNDGGAVHTEVRATSKFHGCRFLQNFSGRSGGGLSNLDGTVEIASFSRVEENTARIAGGGIVNDGNVTIDASSTVENNVPDNCSPRGSIPNCVD